MVRALLCVTLVLAMATWSFGAQIVIDFTEPTSMQSAVYRLMPNSNFGGPNPGNGVHYQLYGAPGTDCETTGTYYNPSDGVYYFDVSALAGATINSAEFKVIDTWWGGDLPNVEVRRINTPATWAQGDGWWGTRWGWHNGVGIWYANYDVVAGQGVDWKGNVTASGSHDPTAEWPSVVADLIDNGPCNGNGGWTYYDIASAVQNWADGTWQNKGLTLYCYNMPWGITTSNPYVTSPTVTIDYTPGVVPEPGTMALIGTGTLAFLAFLRRRRMK